MKKFKEWILENDIANASEMNAIEQEVIAFVKEQKKELGNALTYSF